VRRGVNLAERRRHLDQLRRVGLRANASLGHPAAVAGGVADQGAICSGVYYVDAGDEAADAPGALLEFSHPVTAALITLFPGALPSARVVRPESGMIILFPSYLQHSVRMYNGNRPRVCVPFNVRLRSLRSNVGPESRMSLDEPEALAAHAA
jgi:Putative 2OG-Fe(II) oxygenase